jgi:hypothetical protein
MSWALIYSGSVLCTRHSSRLREISDQAGGFRLVAWLSCSFEKLFGPNQRSYPCSHEATKVKVCVSMGIAYIKLQRSRCQELSTAPPTANKRLSAAILYLPASTSKSLLPLPVFLYILQSISFSYTKNMSGYYKFRCKNFYTHNCGNWVWMNNSACAECVVSNTTLKPFTL